MPYNPERIKNLKRREGLRGEMVLVCLRKYRTQRRKNDRLEGEDFVVTLFSPAENYFH